MTVQSPAPSLLSSAHTPAMRPGTPRRPLRGHCVWRETFLNGVCGAVHGAQGEKGQNVARRRPPSAPLRPARAWPASAEARGESTESEREMRCAPCAPHQREREREARCYMCTAPREMRPVPRAPRERGRGAPWTVEEREREREDPRGRMAAWRPQRWRTSGAPRTTRALSRAPHSQAAPALTVPRRR